MTNAHTITNKILSLLPPFIQKHPLIKRFLGFSAVGVIVTIVGMTLTFIFLKIIGMSQYVTYITSYIITVLLSYYLNSRLVFKSGKSSKNLFIYYAIYSSSLIIGMITLYIYNILLPFDELILNYMVIPVTMVWNFLVTSKFLKPQETNTVDNSTEYTE